LAQPSSSADLIAFLQALPEGRKRRGVRYPQWLLLLMAILGILSGCRSARDQERFAKRHHQAFAAALDLELTKPSSPGPETASNREALSALMAWPAFAPRPKRPASTSLKFRRQEVKGCANFPMAQHNIFL
jgi:hypothetical protein